MRFPRAVSFPVLASALLAVSLAAPIGLDAAGAQAVAKPGHSRGSDPYFPRQGNTGYGVAKYDLHLKYRTSPKRISGVATLRARAHQNLSFFTLDLRRNMKVSSVTVDGHRAAFSQPKKYVQELRIRPRKSIADDKYFTVAIHYGGKVQPLRDPNGSVDGLTPTSDGVVAVSEPQGSPTWYPVNDTPKDKATYDITVGAPKSLKVISNGALRGTVTNGSRRAWHWALGQDTSSYLVTLAIGKFTLKSGRSKSGIPYWYAIDPKQGAGQITKTTAIIDYFRSKFGTYPYGQTGGIVENKPSLGYNLETATRPVYDRAPDIQTLAHELAHQWFGDSVTLERWRDIWLNEGFAQFAMWLYDEHRGSTTAHQRLRSLLSVPASNTAVWNPPPGNPRGPKTMFAGSVYNRGAGTLQALRQKLPDKLFFSILKGWAAAHKHGNARVPQFIAYVNKRSHRNFDSFFHEWLYRKGKPRV